MAKQSFSPSADSWTSSGQATVSKVADLDTGKTDEAKITLTTHRYDAPFFKPPAVSAPYPHPLDEGGIMLYAKDNWSEGDTWFINTKSGKFPAGHVFSFSGSPLQDWSWWIAFRLAEGVVCTLFESVIEQHANPYDFSRAGKCVDLIGNGQIQTIDLKAYGLERRLSAGIWRRTDWTQGFFQIFQDANCGGLFNTIFLEEFPTGSPISLAEWWICDSASSISFPCLAPPQLLELYDEANGTGQSVPASATNEIGKFDKMATLNLGESGMNDRVASFSWTTIQPKKALIQSVVCDYTALISPGNTVTSTIGPVANTTEGPVVVVASVANTDTYSVTASTSLQYSMSLTLGATLTVSAGVEGVGSTSGSITTSFTTAISSTTTKEVTSTQTFELGQSVSFTIPPNTLYTATMSVALGVLPSLSVTTIGEFYYENQIPGSEWDKVSRLYRLYTPVTVNLQGGVGTQLRIVAKDEPIVS